jgi:hypothetical protein
MNSSSLKENCINAFAFKTIGGAVTGFALSILLGFKNRRRLAVLSAGIGGGLASYECESLFKRFKLSEKVESN